MPKYVISDEDPPSILYEESSLVISEREITVITTTPGIPGPQGPPGPPGGIREIYVQDTDPGNPGGPSLWVQTNFDGDPSKFSVWFWQE